MRRTVRPCVTGWLLRGASLSLIWLSLGWHAAGASLPSTARAADAPPALSEQQRISALIDAVDRSGARFVREGKEYSAADARKHLERKLLFAGRRIKTAEDFIEGIASRSSMTGRPYRVRLPTGEELETGIWFRQKLAEIDAGR